MAPKRSAKKAAPPPPPPAASSEETDSRSRSEESEDEDATVESRPPAPNNTPAPPHKGDEEEEEEEEEDESDNEEEPAHAAPAAAPTPNNLPPPPQQGEDPETSDEEEEDDESEDAEEPDEAAPAAAPTPKNQPPPPQQREDPETSDEEEEEEEKEEPTQAAPPSAPNKQPPPQQTDEGEEEGESEEEEEEEAPPKLAPKQAPEGVKPQAAAETKKPAAFGRIWSTDDDVRILEALAAHQKQHGTLPQPDALVDALAGKLDNRAYGSKELQGKVGTLRRRYHALSKRGELPSKEHDRRVLDLSKTIWGGDKSTSAAASVKTAANDHMGKGFEEMCLMFPFLAEEVKELMVENPGMFKREFGKMDDEKARVMDEKIKRQRLAQMKVGLRRHDLTREVTKAIIDLVG